MKLHSLFSRLVRVLAIFIGLVLLWWLVCWAFELPTYLLPTPWQVFQSLTHNASLLTYHAAVTLQEIVIGFVVGVLFGGLTALLMMFFPRLQQWFMPVLIISQAIPVFALAPLLVLWCGFGVLSKVIVAVLVIFFPVMASFYDGLRQTPLGWIDLAKTMGASPWAQLRHVRLMAALPGLGAGLKVAAVVAPIGAVMGEWVGASAGLGFLMLNANARMQTALCFAALFILSIIAVLLWYVIHRLLKKIVYWIPDTDLHF